MSVSLNTVNIPVIHIDHAQRSVDAAKKAADTPMRQHLRGAIVFASASAGALIVAVTVFAFTDILDGAPARILTAVLGALTLAAVFTLGHRYVDKLDAPARLTEAEQRLAEAELASIGRR